MADVFEITRNDYDPSPRRESKNFEASSKNKVRFRKDRHRPKSAESAKESTNDIKRITKHLIEEGIADYEDEQYSDLYHCYSPTENQQAWAEWKKKQEADRPPDKKPDAPFDPLGELNRVFQSRGELSEYKKSLYTQSQAIGKIIADIWRKITYRNIFDKQDLIDIVTQDASIYRARLTARQIAEFTSSIDRFVKKHAIVEKATQLYPDPADLFQCCFGIRPKGHVKIVKGPMTLLIQCFDKDDYENAHNWGVYPVTKDQKDFALLSGGVAFSTAYNPSLNGTVIAENASKNYKLVDGKPVIADINSSSWIRVHEEQHQFNKLFEPLEYSLSEANVVSYVAQSLGRGHRIRKRDNSSFSAQDELKQAKQKFIHEMIRLKRHALGIDRRARDEILAFYRDGRKPLEIESFLTKSPLYDYAKQYEDQIKNIHQEILQTLEKYRGIHIFQILGMNPQSIADEEVNNYTNEVFNIEYKRDVRRWIYALSTLEEKRYYFTEILSLLYHKPVSEWVAFARRAPFKT